MKKIKERQTNVKIWGKPYLIMSIESTLYWVCWILLSLFLLGVIVNFLNLVDHLQRFPVIGIILGIMYFIHNMWITYLKIRIDVYNRVNSKYDRLNNKLDLAISRYKSNSTDKTIINTEQQIQDLSNFLDYINLCAEEFELYRKGFIENDVWLTWVDGMVEKFSSSIKLYKIALKQAKKIDLKDELDADADSDLKFCLDLVISNQSYATYYNLVSLLTTLKPKIDANINIKSS